MANGADELNRALDQARDAMIANGVDRATAEALLFGARPATVDIRGNLADLQRMGAREVSVGADAATVTGEGEVLTAGEAMGDVATGPANAPNEEAEAERTAEPAESTEVNDSMTKAELLAEADRRGVEADDSMTKAQIIDALNA